jgi:hypothetical protein
MAEVQTSTHSGELSQRFIEFVMMQSQQASLFLGRIPHPQTGKAEVFLEPAKLFIDHLEMIREKTRGNLTTQEADILNSVLSDLEIAYVQASSAGSFAPPPESSSPPPEESATESASDAESRKKFSKNYGA